MFKKIILSSVLSLAFCSTAVLADGVITTHPIAIYKITQTCGGIVKHIMAGPIPTKYCNTSKNPTCQYTQKQQKEFIAVCVSYVIKHANSSTQQFSAFFQQKLAEQNINITNSQAEQVIKEGFAEAGVQLAH